MENKNMWMKSTLFILIVFMIQPGCTSSEIRSGGTGITESSMDTTAVSGKAVAVPFDSTEETYNFESEPLEDAEDTTFTFVESVQVVDTFDTAVEEIEKYESGFTVGYRIQILATGDIEKARRAKREAVTKTGLGAYIEYEGGLYKVRVGDFKSRSDADMYRERLKDIYPDCWIVQTTVAK